MWEEVILNRQKSRIKRLDEAQLILAIKSGGNARRDAIEQIYRRYSSSIRAYFYSRFRSAPSEDLMQETFVQIVRKLQQYEGRGPFDAWIWTVARNIALEYLRKPAIVSENQNVSIDDDGCPALAYHSDDISTRDCVRQGILEFWSSEPQRAEVLSRSVIEGWSIRELADFLGRTPAATREYISQCRKKIKPFIAHCLEHIGITTGESDE